MKMEVGNVNYFPANNQQFLFPPLGHRTTIAIRQLPAIIMSQSPLPAAIIIV